MNRTGDGRAEQARYVAERGPKPWDVVAYTFKAEILCPNCTIESLKTLGLAEAYDSSDDLTIATIGQSIGIDTIYPESYDSDDFPKFVFRDAIENQHCDSCRAVLS